MFRWDRPLDRTVELVMHSIRCEANAQDAAFMRDVFGDLVKGFWGAVECAPLNLDLQRHPNAAYH